MCHVLRLIEIKSGNRYFFWNEQKESSEIESTKKEKWFYTNKSHTKRQTILKWSRKGGMFHAKEFLLYINLQRTSI